MNQPTATRTTARSASAHATGPAPTAVASLVDQLRAGLGAEQAGVVLWFASSEYAPEYLAGPIAEAFPGAAVLGCSTAGEFTETAGGVGGLSAVALPASVALDATAVLAELDGGVAEGMGAAIAELEGRLGSLRDLDPADHLGLVLLDGTHGVEEQVNAVLGNAAPLLEVVGGSAGDDLAFEETWVVVGDRVSRHGVALVVARSTAPYRVVKTCSFRPFGASLQVTRADTAARIVWEFDGRPALEAYAEVVGVDSDEIGSEEFMRHPVGLMMDGAPFIRSPQKVLADGGLKFYCEILEGMQVEVMEATDLLAETRAAVARARADLGGTISGGVLFNCILRRLDLDEHGTHAEFREIFADFPAAGFHTYGETWMGHMNQTLTGVVFG